MAVTFPDYMKQTEPIEVVSLDEALLAKTCCSVLYEAY